MYSNNTLVPKSMVLCDTLQFQVEYLTGLKGCECFDIIRPNTQNLINNFFSIFLRLFFYIFIWKITSTRFLYTLLQLLRLYKQQHFHSSFEFEKGKNFSMSFGGVWLGVINTLFFNIARHYKFILFGLFSWEGSFFFLHIFFSPLWILFLALRK